MNAPAGSRAGENRPRRAGRAVGDRGDIGTQYVLFLNRDGARGLHLVNLSGGIMAVAPDRTIEQASPQGVLRGPWRAEGSTPLVSERPPVGARRPGDPRRRKPRHPSWLALLAGPSAHRAGKRTRWPG